MTNSQIISDYVNISRNSDFSNDQFVGSVTVTVLGKTETVTVNRTVGSITLLESLLRDTEIIESFEISQEPVEENRREQKYPTVYRCGGSNSRWIATMQFLTEEEAQAYINKFDDERTIRWVKYRPQRVKFTRGGCYRESGIPSSNKLGLYILGH